MQVHQFHGSVADHDAIGGQIISIRRILEDAGIQSQVFCFHPSPGFSAPAHTFREYHAYSSPDNVLLLHYSIAYPDAVWAWLRRIPDRKIVIYHNITPPHYYLGINAQYYRETRKGLEQLSRLRSVADEAWGVSDFNCRALVENGWGTTRTLSLIFDPERYDFPPDPTVTERLSDGRPNVLFVGRCVPNKRWDDLIITFHQLKRYVLPDARLCLVGSARGMAPYERFLRALVERLGLNDVIFAGRVSQAELVAYYQAADVFLCMSEHEGFGMPLVESMQFGVPVLAFKAAAVPETLGGAGTIFRRKDYGAVAELAGMLVKETVLRERIITQQRLRASAFYAASIRERLLRYLRSPKDGVDG
jgi:glycosyltransferase involved in cell wall biosynthesis